MEGKTFFIRFQRRKTQEKLEELIAKKEAKQESVISLLKLWEHMRIAFPPIYIYTKYIVLIALPICEADQEKKSKNITTKYFLFREA